MFNWLKQLLLGKDQNEMEYAKLIEEDRKRWLDRNDSFKDKVQVWLDNEIIEANKRLMKDAELELEPGFAPPPTQPVEKRKPGRSRKVKV